MSRHLSDYVDIGGECFAVIDTVEPPPQNDSKTYDLICKSKTEFRKIFGDIIRQYPDTVSLFRAYLPYGETQLQGLQHSDKAMLKKIIEARMETLKSSIASSNQTIKNIQFVRYYDNLSALLKTIDQAKGMGVTTTPAQLQARIKKLSKERIFYILLEMAWKLIHPEMIERGTEDTWMKMLDNVDALTLGRLVESIQGINDPTKYSRRIDIEQVERASNSIVHAASPPDDAVELRRRLEAILQVLTVKRYLKKPVLNAKGPIVNDTTITGLNKQLSKSMTPSQTGGAISMISLYDAMAPFYEFFEKKYEPITTILSNAPAVESISLPSLAQLLFVCEKISSRSPPDHGIYRVTNLDVSVMDYLRGQLGTIRTHLTDPSVTEEQKAEYTKSAELLPIVSITSLLNKFGKSGHYNDPKKIPHLQIMMVGQNMSHYPTADDMKVEDIGDFPKDKIYEAASEFFTETSVYLVCTSSDAIYHDIPMKVYEIDDMMVDVAKRAMNINELKDNYFNKYQKPSIFLENVMKLETDMMYPHGMLALSMFMASKELLPK